MFFDDGDPNQPAGEQTGGDAPAAPMGDAPMPAEGGDAPAGAPMGGGDAADQPEGGDAPAAPAGDAGNQG